MPQNKRRGTIRQRKDDDSESDSGEDRSADADEVSASPDVPSQPLSRRSSNVDKLSREGFGPLPQIAVTLDRRDEGPLPGPSSLRAVQPPHLSDGRGLFRDNELPAIATLALPEPSPSTPVPMSAPTLLPLRPASEQHAAHRKRAATVPGKIPRTAANSGPKVVACNFCRGVSSLQSFWFPDLTTKFQLGRPNAMALIQPVRAVPADRYFVTISMTPDPLGRAKRKVDALLVANLHLQIPPILFRLHLPVWYRLRLLEMTRMNPERINSPRAILN